VARGESVNQESGGATRVADAVDEFTKLFLLVSTNSRKKGSTGTDSGTMLHSARSDGTRAENNGSREYISRQVKLLYGE